MNSPCCCCCFRRGQPGAPGEAAEEEEEVEVVRAAEECDGFEAEMEPEAATVAVAVGDFNEDRRDMDNASMVNSCIADVGAAQCEGGVVDEEGGEVDEEGGEESEEGGEEAGEEAADEEGAAAAYAEEQDADEEVVAVRRIDVEELEMFTVRYADNRTSVLGDGSPLVSPRSDLGLLDRKTVALQWGKERLKKHLLELINRKRLEHGREPLVFDERMKCRAKTSRDNYTRGTASQREYLQNNATRPNSNITNINCLTCRLDNWECHEIPSEVIKFWYTMGIQYDHNMATQGQEEAQRRFAQLIDDSCKFIGLSMGVLPGSTDSSHSLIVVAALGHFDVLVQSGDVVAILRCSNEVQSGDVVDVLRCSNEVQSGDVVDVLRCSKEVQSGDVVDVLRCSNEVQSGDVVDVRRCSNEVQSGDVVAILRYS